jgi:ribonuclease HI
MNITQKLLKQLYKKMSRLIKIYTDGSSIGNPGPGGYGIVMLSDNEDYKKEFSQGFNLTTNNRMELLAVIVALEKIKIKNSKVKVYTDSKYVSDAVEKGWLFNWVKKDFKNKKNPDLWRRFLRIYNDHEVKFQWVKGHNNDFYNERCDFLANLATKNSNLKEDKGYTTNLT